MTLRDKVFDALESDGALNGLGIDADTLYPNWTADSPQSPRFLILRWGTTVPGVGVARPIDLSLWAYDREPDYGGIERILQRSRVVLELLIGQPTGDGHVMSMDWMGASPDLKDDVYNAVVRHEDYRVVASGI